MPLILPGNVASATAAVGYSIDNSCRFDGSSSFLAFTLGSETNRDKWTWSCWFKRSKISTTSVLHHVYIDGDNHNFFKFDSSDALNFNNETGASVTGKLFTNALYRDISAWYHAMIVYDSANATAGNRMRMYVNGTEVTSFETDTQPSSGQDSFFYNTKVVNIGRDQRGTSGFWDGYMAEIIYCDGQAYGPDKFGEFDSDSPTIWKPIDPAEQSLTFGNNGFWLDFEDSSAMGNDVSGNNNDWSVTGIAAVDQATDTPTNNFCTWNPLFANTGYWSGETGTPTFAEGNCSQAGNPYSTMGTMATTVMPFYYEMNITANIGDAMLGVMGSTPVGGVSRGFDDTSCYGAYVYSDNNQKIVAGSRSTWTSGLNGTGTYMAAVDPTNNKMWIGKDGSWDGNPASGTGNLLAPSANYEYTPWSNNLATSTSLVNFGGCSAFTVSSGNADGNGYGNFEYAPPSGFLALCTKNLGSDGG